MLRALLFVPFLVGMALPAGAQGASSPAPDSRPVVAGVTRRVLPNGLTVLVQERHTAPVVTTMMWYRVGARDELPGSTGLAHFLEHLMFKGTRRIGKGMVDRLTYQNGGSNNAFTADDYTAYQFSFPRGSWKVALRIEADRMRNLLLDPKEFEAERKVVMEERRQYEDDPATQLDEQLNGVAFLAHPYRNPTIGWMPDLRRVTRSEVVRFYEQYYLPANAVLVIVGDVRAGDALRAATTAFAPVPKLPAPVRRQVIEPPQIAQRRIELALPANLPRLELLLHVPQRGHPDLYPLEILQYALTDGKTSRLYERLVEKDQVASDVFGDLGVSRDPGRLLLGVELKQGSDPRQAEAALWAELRAAAQAPLSERALQKAKNAIEARFVQQWSTTLAAAEELGQAEAIGGYEYLLAYLDQIRKVTAVDVQRVAADYLRPDRSSTGQLTPRPEGASGRTRSRVVDRLEAVPRVGRGQRARPRSRGSRSPWRRRSRPRKVSVPAPKPPAAMFPPLKVTRQVLPNGLTLLLLENHDLPTVTLSAQGRVGARDDAEATAGLASFTADMLEEGTRSHAHEQISETLEFVGAEFGASAGRTTTTATLRCLSRHLPPLLALYAEMITRPTFPADRVALVKSQILTAIQAADEDPGDVAERAFMEAVYGQHPNHRPTYGYARTVSAITPEQLRDFHARTYVPGAFTLVVVGDFQTDTMLAQLAHAFEGWTGMTTMRPAPPDPPRPAAAVNVRRVMEKAQTQIVLGHTGIRRTDPDYIPLLVMDSILGEGVAGGFTARIPYQLRDIQGLAYSVGSSITGSTGLEPGVFMAEMSTEPKNEGKAIAGLLAEIRRICAQPVTGEELREAIHYLITSYVFDFETNGQLASYLLTTNYYDLGFDYRNQFPNLLRKVTGEAVQRVAREHLDPDHYTVVIVGPPPKP
jgi:zinc protease